MISDREGNKLGITCGLRLGFRKASQRPHLNRSRGGQSLEIPVSFEIKGPDGPVQRSRETHFSIRSKDDRNDGGCMFTGGKTEYNFKVTPWSDITLLFCTLMFFKLFLDHLLNFYGFFLKFFVFYFGFRVFLLFAVVFCRFLMFFKSFTFSMIYSHNLVVVCRVW